jgi:hypothetical protein
MMTPDHLPDLIDVHNELSPLLGRVEVLIDLAMESESSEQRLGVIHDLLRTEAAHLRTRLDILCEGSHAHAC